MFFSVEGLGLIKLYFPCVSEIKMRKCRYDKVYDECNKLTLPIRRLGSKSRIPAFSIADDGLIMWFLEVAPGGS